MSTRKPIYIDCEDKYTESANFLISQLKLLENKLHLDDKLLWKQNKLDIEIFIFKTTGINEVRKYNLKLLKKYLANSKNINTTFVLNEINVLNLNQKSFSPYDSKFISFSDDKFKSWIKNTLVEKNNNMEFNNLPIYISEKTNYSSMPNLFLVNKDRTVKDAICLFYGFDDFSINRELILNDLSNIYKDLMLTTFVENPHKGKRVKELNFNKWIKILDDKLEKEDLFDIWTQLQYNRQIEISLTTQLSSIEDDIIFIDFKENYLFNFVLSITTTSSSNIKHFTREIMFAYQFYDYLGLVNTKNQLETNINKNKAKIALFYTDEDENIVSYVRKHIRDINNASGDYCDVIVLEKSNLSEQNNSNKRLIDYQLYWRKKLVEKMYIFWSILGWNVSIPYDKSEIYTIIKKLNIPIDALPCAGIFENGKLVNYVSLESNPKIALRSIFSAYQRKNIQEKNRNLLKEIKNEKNIFLSYSSKDKNYVKTIAELSKTTGLNIWYDEYKIEAGDSIVKKIEDSFLNIDYFVIFLSKASLESKWVQKEYRTAMILSLERNRNIKIIPILIEDVEIPIFLKEFSFIKEGSPFLAFQKLLVVL